MHLLLIYTGEFRTKNAPIGGIFQLNQAKLLTNSISKVNILNPSIISPRFFFKSKNFDDVKKLEKVRIYQSYRKNIFPKKIDICNYTLRKKYENLSLDLFEKYIEDNGLPDMCHVFDIRFGLVAGNIIKKKFNIPYIFSEYCVETANKTLNLSKNYMDKYVRPSLNRCDYIALPSKKFAKKFKKFIGLKKKINILPPVIPQDLNYYSSYKSSKTFNFIIVSRLDKNKNIETPIKAFTKLNNKNIKLLIIGDGPERSNIEKYLIDKRIKLFKNLTRDQMLNKLSNSDCIICSSFHETFGVGLVEAAYFGLSIISSNCEGPSEIVNKINGILLKKNIVNFYIKAMTLIISKKKRFKSIQIKKDVLARYGKLAYLKKFRIISNNLL